MLTATDKKNEKSLKGDITNHHVTRLKVKVMLSNVTVGIYQFYHTGVHEPHH